MYPKPSVHSCDWPNCHELADFSTAFGKWYCFNHHEKVLYNQAFLIKFANEKLKQEKTA